MTSPEASNYILSATTPSLGARIWIEESKVCVQVANEGGRGAPRWLVLLPFDLDRSQPKTASAELERIYADQKCLQQHRRRLHRTLPTPSTKRFDATQWSVISPAGAPVLALVIFVSTDPSGAAAPPVDAILDATNDEAAVDPIVAIDCRVAAERTAIDEFLTNQFPEATVPRQAFSAVAPPAIIRRGLIRIDPSGALGDPAADGHFRAPRADVTTTFALASCQYPAGLLDGTPHSWPSGPHGPADASMLRLAARLNDPRPDRRPSLLMLAGDQIYADPTAGLFDPRVRTTPLDHGAPESDPDWLRVPYQNWLGSVGAQSVFGLVPACMMLDDHEIRDNWEPLPEPVNQRANEFNEALRREGLEAYGQYQRDRPFDRPLPHAWRPYDHGGLRFFMADTRTERKARKASISLVGSDAAPTIMGPGQEKALRQWLSRESTGPAFVLSSAMLLPRHSASARCPSAALRADGWDGYPRSLHALLAHLWQRGRSDVVFLSGDEHLSCVARAVVSGPKGERPITLYSIHSSALYAPYPFANSIPEDFAEPDDWLFTDPLDTEVELRCRVEVLAWVPADGFACLTVTRPAEGGWRLDVEFDREAGVMKIAALP